MIDEQTMTMAYAANGQGTKQGFAYLIQTKMKITVICHVPCVLINRRTHLCQFQQKLELFVFRFFYEKMNLICMHYSTTCLYLQMLMI